MKTPFRAGLLAAVAAWLWVGGAETRRSDEMEEIVEASQPGTHGSPFAWQVLAPRHRGESPMPVVIFVTPGWLGPAELRIETARGVHAAVTSARSVAWPSTLAPLEVGEWCAVTVAGAFGRRGESAYLRAPSGTPAVPPAGRCFLSIGLPSAAILQGGPHVGVALLRAGLDRQPWFPASDTMARDRERRVQAPRPR